ncbi:MAG: regulatory protein RecX [Bacteroidota bacterium]|nr:regulatory protein RecX [Bacteroidota bacterium]
MQEKENTDIKIAIEKLKKYCAVIDRCKWDVIQKIKSSNLMKTKQDDILKILIQEKYIDEERYSRLFCRGKFKIKKWGKNKIIHELKKKHISKICINKGLLEINENEYLKELNIQYQKKKKTINEKNQFIKKKKIATYLINKGYESNLVWNKITKLKE